MDYGLSPQGLERQKYLAEGSVNAIATPVPLKTRVQSTISDLKSKIKKQEELLELLEKNPDFERMLTLLSNY